MDQILNWRLFYFGLCLSSVLTACGGSGGSTSVATNDSVSSTTSSATTIVSNPVVVGLGTSSEFDGTWVMGSPTTEGVTFNVHSPNQAGLVAIDYGVTSLQYTQQLQAAPLEIDKPLELRLQNLKPGTRYFYRLLFQSSISKQWTATPEYEFQTAKQAGQSFMFAIQGDSHPERLKTQFDADLYKRTLLRAAADKPDFYILSGDDFSVDTLNPDTINAAQVRERYTLQRPYSNSS